MENRMLDRYAYMDKVGLCVILLTLSKQLYDMTMHHTWF